MAAGAVVAATTGGAGKGARPFERIITHFFQELEVDDLPPVPDHVDFENIAMVETGGREPRSMDDRSCRGSCCTD